MKKKIFIIALIVFLVLGIVFVFGIINNNYVTKISKALKNTLNAEYVEFNLNLNDNNFIGNMEYDANNLDFLINCTQNDKEMKIDINKESSSFSYYLKAFDEWITVDITSIVEKILPKENTEFEITKIFDLAGIDDVIDISDFPKEISNDFKLKLLDKDFLNKTLGFKEEKKNKEVTYTFKPNTYNFLKEYIESSNLEKNKISEITQKLKESKQELEKLKFKISISIDENDYITNIDFQKIKDDEQVNANIDLTKYK